MRWVTGALAAAGALVLAASSWASDEPMSNPPPSAPKLAAAPSPAAAAATGGEYTRPNPEAVSGVLPNGLKYTVMRRGGARQASIVLYLDVGSVNETETELGVAHFLEHMAFNGSPAFPGETLPRTFAGIGVALGRDQNASTSVTGTVYRLDISEETDAKLDLSFRWLRDVADNLTIGEDQVERERGVVMSEYTSGLGTMQTLADQTVSFMAPDARGAARDPIGTPDSIRTMTAQRVRGFYEKWYRPDNATVIVVADAPVSQLEQRVKDTFGAWEAKGPKPAKPDPGKINPKRPADLTVLTDPHAPDVVQVCRGRDPDARTKEGVVTRIRDFEDVAWGMALKNRLDRLSNSGDPPFVAASLDTSELYDTMAFVCIQASVRDGNWKRALTVISDETRRLDLHGVTQSETTSALKEMKGMMDASAGVADTQPAATLADIILHNYLRGGTFSTAREDVRIGTMALAKVTPESVTAAFRKRWRTGEPLVMVISDTPVGVAEVRREWDMAQASAAPTALAERGELNWGYKTFGAPGQVVERTFDAKNDLVRVRFANGLKVTFKSTENATDRVTVRIRFGHGQQEIPGEQMMVANLGSQMMQLGGLKKNNFDDTVTLCEGHLCDVGFSIDRDSFVLGGTTRPSDLDVELQLLTAYLVDPGFSKDIDSRIPSAITTLDRVMAADPGFQAQKARGAALLAPRVIEFRPTGELAKARSADFERLLRPALIGDALEVTIIGDIDETTALDALAKTLGAIPARTGGQKPPAKAATIRYPANPPVIRVTHDGPADKAVVLVTFPAFVYTPERTRDGRALDLLADILQGETLESIREDLGATYSPMVYADLSKGGDEGSLVVQIETTPATADRVLAMVRQIAQRLAAGDIDAAALERARRPRLDRGGIRESTNEWWLEVLDGSWRHPEQLKAAETWQSDYEGVTLAEVKAQAAKWLSRSPLVVVVTPRLGGASTTASAGAPARK